MQTYQLFPFSFFKLVADSASWKNMMMLMMMNIIIIIIISIITVTIIFIIIIIQRRFLSKIMNIAIRSTYFIFCRRNKDWTDPDLMDF